MDLKSEAMKNSIFIFLLLLMFSCELQEIETPEEVTPISSYKWVKSPISPVTTIYFSLFDQDENGNLYGYGYEVSDRVFYKLEGDKWRVIHEIKQDGIISNLESFTVYNDVIYYSSFNKIYRVENGLMNEVYSSPKGMIFYIKAFKGKILIAGENLDLNGDNYTLINFDGSEFQAVSKQLLTSRGAQLENKILFTGFPGLTYDGENVTLNNIFGYIAGADNMDNIYVIDKEVNTYKIIQKRNNDARQIGVQITLSSNDESLSRLDYIDNTFSVIGKNDLTNHLITFVLNKNTWERVDIEDPLIFRYIFRYQGRLIGCTDKGELHELVKK